MQRLTVDSSDIVSIGYDPQTSVLEVEFHEGRVYQYRDVLADIYEQFLHAESHGHYFNSYINGRYRYDRIDDAPTYTLDGTVAFATGNERKLADLRLACEQYDIEVEQLDLPVDEIQSDIAADIATKKAKAAYKLANRPVLVNDSFWSILALRGFPGAYMSEVTKWFQPEDFLKLMEGKSERSIVCTDTLVYYDGKRTKVFAKDYNGTITEEPRGAGLAIDQVVMLQGQTKTIAELSETDESAVVPEDTIWQQFAKWYSIQRRIRG